MLSGVLNVDKPEGMTSHDVVDKIRRSAGMKKIGHTGTLDPMATGVLPLCLGKATRIVQYLQADDKQYDVETTLGIVTDSQDITGKVVETRPVLEISEERIREIMVQFLGMQQQVPPMVSAGYHQGQRLYELARKGIEVKREPRAIEISEIRLEEIDLPKIRFVVTCSKGAYMRTLCHDIGQRLGCGATMSALRRLRSGRFSIERAVSLEKLQSPDEVRDRLLDMNEALSSFPAVELEAQAAKGLLHGVPVRAESVRSTNGTFRCHDLVRLCNSGGRLLAVARARIDCEALFEDRTQGRVFDHLKVLAEPGQSEV